MYVDGGEEKETCAMKQTRPYRVYIISTLGLVYFH